MRYTRGVFQSLGAGGSLLAAAACALFVVSAAVGFRGWPGLSGDGTGHHALVLFSGASPAPRPQRAGRPSGAFAVSHRVLAAAEPGAPAPRRGSAPALRVSAAHPRVPSASGHPAVTPTTAASTAPAAATPSSPGRSATAPVAKTVRGAGQAAGATVAPVSPAAAQTVTDATGKVADTVDRAGGLLAP